jgi:hypothetical protein
VSNGGRDANRIASRTGEQVRLMVVLGVYSYYVAKQGIFQEA